MSEEAFGYGQRVERVGDSGEVKLFDGYTVIWGKNPDGVDSGEPGHELFEVLLLDPDGHLVETGTYTIGACNDLSELPVMIAEVQAAAQAIKAA